MCFSAEADVVASIVVGAVGIDALRHATRSAERWLGSIPLVLAGHQLVEAFVWWGLEGHVSHAVWRTALFVYLIVAFGVLPVLVPIAVGALEPISNRRRIGVFASIGGVVSAVLMYSVLRGPVEAHIEHHHISYNVNLWHGGILVTLYVVATCGSLLLSSYRHVRWFGAVNVVVVCLLAVVDQTAFISLWCAWAAVTSLAIAGHLRHSTPTSQAADLVLV